MVAFTYGDRVTINQDSQFGEVLTSARTPIIELNSSYGTSLIRDAETTTGSGSVALGSNGEIVVKSVATMPPEPDYTAVRQKVSHMVDELYAEKRRLKRKNEEALVLLIN